MISTSLQLENYLKVIKDESKLAIDTEFKRIDTYYPELCLIQIATSNSIECIDVLAIKDLEPLFKKLYDKKTLWIVHSARQDIEALFFLSKRVPVSIFDTQIAASLLNFPLQISYQLLTELIQKVSLEKKHTRFDWTIRPLPKDVLKYALDDVRYLFKNYEFLKKELINSNKVEWMEEEVDFLLHQSLYEPNFMQIIKKTKERHTSSHNFRRRRARTTAKFYLWRSQINGLHISSRFEGKTSTVWNSCGRHKTWLGGLSHDRWFKKRRSMVYAQIGSDQNSKGDRSEEAHYLRAELLETYNVYCQVYS